MIVKVQCPYCKEKKGVDIETGLNLIDCYPEDGGCDETFAVKLELTPTVEIFSLQPYTPVDEEITCICGADGQNDDNHKVGCPRFCPF
jgi:hypothetical protein